MAARKVNLVAESSHIAVINKVAGITISPLAVPTTKMWRCFLKKKDKKSEKEAFFHKTHMKKILSGSGAAVINQMYTACSACRVYGLHVHRSGSLMLFM